MPPRSFLVTACLWLAACASDPRASSSSHDQMAMVETHMKRFREALSRDDSSTAETEMRNVELLFKPNDPDYLDRKLYVQHAKVLDFLGWLQLEQSKFVQAKESNFRAFNVLIEGDQKRIQQIKAQDQAHNDMMAGLAVASTVLSGLAGVAGVATSNPAVVSQAQNNLSMLQLALPNMMIDSTTDFRRAIELESIDTDGVRMPVLGESGPFSFVGVVTNGTSNCTGTLLRGGRVLTARHCFYTKGLYPVRDQGQWKFEKSGLEETTTAQVVRVIEPADPYVEADRANDWAVLELDKTLPSDLFLMPPSVIDTIFGSESVNRLITVAGYSSDLFEGSILTVDAGCPSRRMGALVAYDCVTYQGASGGPVLGYGENLDFVLGVNVAGLPANPGESRAMGRQPGRATGVLVSPEMYQAVVGG